MFLPSTSLLASSASPKQAELCGLIQQAQARDHAAFERLYEQYKWFIWNRLVYLVKEREAAYDLFQETFIHAWNKLPSLRDTKQFESWLARIAANLAIDFLRREKKLLFLPLLDDEGGTEIGLPQPQSSRLEEHVIEKECVEQALQDLSPRHRTCMLLHDQWGFSQREIASLLNISEKSVSAYMSRGREQFRQSYLRSIGE